MRRHSRESVIQLMVDAGASPELAATVFDELARVGLNAADVRSWVMHPQRHHTVPAGALTAGGVTIPRNLSPMTAIENGEDELLLAELRRFADALPAERRIATLFGGSIEDVQRLTGGDPARAAVVVTIADELLKRLGKIDHVYLVAQTELTPASYERIVDRILRGEERAVLAELEDGTIDVTALQRDAMPLNYGW